jgi:hypothetical protein
MGCMWGAGPRMGQVGVAASRGIALGQEERIGSIRF